METILPFKLASFQFEPNVCINASFASVNCPPCQETTSFGFGVRKDTLAFLFGTDRWVPAGPCEAILIINYRVKFIHKS